MRRAVVGVVLVLVLFGGVVPSLRADVTGDQVREAIDRAVAYLKRQQQPDGAWPDYLPSRGGPVAVYHGGVTALSTLALLNAGVEPDDDCIRRALKHLRKVKPETTYVTSLQTMVFAKAIPEIDRLLVARNVAWLERVQITEGAARGGWEYADHGRWPDNSNSQFALLALHEAERIGVGVQGQTWRLAKAYWEKGQNPDGSWGYRLDQRSGRTSGLPSGSMTCAGIASLVIASNMVRGTNAQAEGDRIRCCLESKSDDNPIRRGLEWLGSHFAVRSNPFGAREGKVYHLYYLYGVERVGRMTAHRFLGSHDWYREGAEHLLRMKGGAASDHWIGIFNEENTLVATSFALLFLSKGRRPILLSKLKHGGDDDWNRHQSDVGNLTRYVESRWKRDLTWQVVDLKAAKVEDLLESPVLYFSGRNNPLPASAAAQEQLARKLRDYVDRGGFLWVEAYSSGADFDRAFRAFLNERVFPEPEYRLAPLPPEHPIWRTEEAVDAKYVRPLWGIEFGCRTSVVYFPPEASGHVRPSLSCLWELSRRGREEEFSPEVQGQVGAGLSIGINVLAYATNRELKFKDPARPEPVKSQTGGPSGRGRLYVANLRHVGGCDAAPRALLTLLETAGRELNLRVGVEKRELNITDQALFDYPLVFMHGRNAFRLTDAERKQLRTYVERGGTVFANAICASRSFTEAFRREMATIFPDQPLEPVPKDHPLFTADAFGGFDLSTVTRRDPQAKTRNEPLEDILRQVSPELEGVRIGERYGVLFSRYDLSCALEKRDSLECQGYVRADAARIGMNVLLYSLQE